MPHHQKKEKIRNGLKVHCQTQWPVELIFRAEKNARAHFCSFLFKDKTKKDCHSRDQEKKKKNEELLDARTNSFTQAKVHRISFARNLLIRE